MGSAGSIPAKRANFLPVALPRKPFPAAGYGLHYLPKSPAGSEGKINKPTNSVIIITNNNNDKRDSGNDHNSDYYHSHGYASSGFPSGEKKRKDGDGGGGGGLAPKNTSVEFGGSRRGFVNFLDLYQGPADDDEHNEGKRSTEASQVVLAAAGSSSFSFLPSFPGEKRVEQRFSASFKSRSGVEILDNAPPECAGEKEKGGAAGGNKISRVKSLNSILLQTKHPSGSIGSRGGGEGGGIISRASRTAGFGIHAHVSYTSYSSNSLNNISTYSSSNDEPGRQSRGSLNDSCAQDREEMFNRVENIIARIRIHCIENEFDDAKKHAKKNNK